MTLSWHTFQLAGLYSQRPRLQLVRMNNLSVDFYIFCSFFELANVFINDTTFCTPNYPINILMSEKIFKVKNSVTGIYLQNFG